MTLAKRKFLSFLLLLVCLLSITSTVKANIVKYDRFGGAITCSHEPYIISPTNTTYQENNLLLNVRFYAEVWGNTNFTMIYSLDGKANQTFPLASTYIPFTSGRHNESYCSGSAALPRLDDGLHEITVYLQMDYEGGNKTGTYHEFYYDKETAIFSIGSSTVPQLTLPSPTINTQTQYLAPSPTMPEFSILAIMPLLIAILTATIMIRVKKLTKPNRQSFL